MQSSRSHNKKLFGISFPLPASFSLFPQLSNRRFRAAAMLSVFIVSAVVHEYALALCFGFFYPVMFCLFAVFGGKEIYLIVCLTCSNKIKMQNQKNLLLSNVYFLTYCKINVFFTNYSNTFRSNLRTPSFQKYMFIYCKYFLFNGVQNCNS